MAEPQKATKNSTQKPTENSTQQVIKESTGKRKTPERDDDEIGTGGANSSVKKHRTGESFLSNHKETDQSGHGGSAFEKQQTLLKSGQASAQPGNDNGTQATAQNSSLDQHLHAANITTAAGLTAPAEQLNYLQRSYRNFEEHDAFRGRLKYWMGQQKKNTSDVFRLPRDTTGPFTGKLSALSNVDSHAAIATVTEAISEAPNPHAYGVIDAGRIDSTRIASKVSDMGDARIVRRDQPLIISWLFTTAPDPGRGQSKAEEKKDKESKAAKEDPKGQKKRETDVVASINSTVGRHIVCVVADRIHLRNRPDGLPWIRFLDSARGYMKDNNQDLIANVLNRLCWFHGAENRVEPVPAPILWSWNPVAAQNLSHWPLEPCGVHTVLNGWAVALGLENRINPSLQFTRKDYDMVIALVELAMSGNCDFWLLYSFMVESEFVTIPTSLKTHWPDGLDQRGVDDLIRRLTDDGVKFFDRTIGPGHLDTQDWLYQRVEDADLVEQVAKAESNQTTNPNNTGSNSADDNQVLGSDEPPTATSNITGVNLSDKNKSPQSDNSNMSDSSSKLTLKTKIEDRLRVLLVEHYKDKDPESQEMQSKAIKACHNLAFLVQDHLSLPRYPQRCGLIKTFEQLAEDVMGKYNNQAVPLVLKTVMEVVAAEFGVELNSEEVLGEKLERIRRGVWPLEGVDWDWEHVELPEELANDLTEEGELLADDV